MLQIFQPPIQPEHASSGPNAKQKQIIRINVNISKSSFPKQPAILTLQILCALLG
jgi:hypothetical protein